MRWTPALPLLLLACPPKDETPDEDPPIDLVTPLGAGEARAGVITDPAAALGGLGAESRPGDVLLVNDRVRFVVQSPDRPSAGLEPYGGGILDADVARTDGTLDDDLVVDWSPALDVGWLPEADTVEVVDDGLESGTAVVRVEAHEAGFAYLGAVFEDADRYPDRGLSITTTYTLPADSPLLRVETTITAGDTAVDTRPGDILQSFPGAVSPWVPGIGRAATFSAAEDAVMAVHDEHGTTLGIFADDADGSSTPEGSLDLLNFLLSFTSLYEPKATLEAGASRTWTRWYGVARTPSVLTDAWLDATGEAAREVTATVTSGGEPVAGARVTAVVDGAPWTLAISDAEGRVTLRVPDTEDVRLVADGSGSRLHRDLPDGAGHVSPLGHVDRREAAIASFADGTTAIPHARGLGRVEGAPGDTLALTPPALLRITSEATDRFEVRVKAVVGEGESGPPDDGLGLALPGDHAALAWARAGTVEIPLEPGVYDVLAWHGTRWEVHQERVTLTSGETTALAATDLVPAFDVPGWFVGDTHIHAIPSFDGKLSPADRALVVSGVGLDVWFGTEHDVAVDHAPMVEAMGLSDHLRVVGGVEVTPWVRGHLNIFPNTADPDARAGGAWPWWEDLPTSTDDQVTKLRSAHPGVLVQVNHPFSPGMPSLAGWSEEGILRPDSWFDDFDMVEVIVPGQDPRGLDLYLDLVEHGVLAAATGSTDSHDHTQNDPGLLATWFHVPEATGPADITDEALVASIEGLRTVATNGPFLELDPLPGSVVTGSGTLDVTVHTPTWMPVDRVVLYRGAERLEVATPDVDGRVSFDLQADADVGFVVVAESDTPVTALPARPAWAISSAVLLDVDGNGWDAPKPSYRD